MKITNARLDEIADQWSGAYRADYNGRAVSCQIIKAMFEEGIDLVDAKEIYFSKNLRWFFDGQGDNVPVREAAEKFKLYLKRNMSYIKDMLKDELGRTMANQGAGWLEA